MAPRNVSAGKWRLELKTLGVFVNNKQVYSPSNDAIVSLNQKTVQFNHNNDFKSEYINTSEGIRQNFIINKEPVIQNSKGKIQKDEPQTLNLKLQTSPGWFINKVHDKEIHFAKATRNGHDKKITYNGLKVWDANNKELAARFAVNKKHDGFEIEVNAKDAAYPITIDPLSTTASTQLEINQTNAFLGYSVASAGDVNGDGYSDVIVGAYLYSNPVPPFQPGAAFIFHGSATGISTTVQAYLKCDQTTQSNFGISVASAGDVNKDGYSDVIVGPTIIQMVRVRKEPLLSFMVLQPVLILPFRRNWK
ncbi:MAG: FG-GAP repeat protein [Chitinophagaceae bacterium]|nr:FG-GAP repeat protein [Chitinophagaceae bacterium]